MESGCNSKARANSGKFLTAIVPSCRIWCVPKSAANIATIERKGESRGRKVTRVRASALFIANDAFRARSLRVPGCQVVMKIGKVWKGEQNDMSCRRTYVFRPLTLTS